MGMFGDLDNLSKRQQNGSPRKQSVHEAARPQVVEPASLSPPSLAVVSTPDVATESTKKSTMRAPSEPQKRQRVSERPNVRTNERTKIRHSFDVFQDQYLALRDLAHERQRGSLKKVPLGDLVQEALDLYLGTQRSSSS